MNPRESKGQRSAKDAVPVAAGVILHDGEVLLQKRGPGGHLAGLWEFPGGKVKRGETEKAALAREIREEIGIEVEILHRLLTTTHDYPDRQVAISYFLCALRGGRPPLEEASIRWVRPDEIHEESFPPANAAVLELLREGKLVRASPGAPGQAPGGNPGPGQHGGRRTR